MLAASEIAVCGETGDLVDLLFACSRCLRWDWRRTGFGALCKQIGIMTVELLREELEMICQILNQLIRRPLDWFKTEEIVRKRVKSFRFLKIFSLCFVSFEFLFRRLNILLECKSVSK